ncbi:MAG: aminotransferase class V-fold PLP-dependent enzyme [Alphaproteobacteria bacterium]
MTALRKNATLASVEPASADPDWAALRRRYPAALDRTYANIGSRGLISIASHAAGQAALDADLAMRESAPPVAQQAEEARALFARIIGAAADEIAITKNVSEGLNAIATAIDWQDGDEVVLASEIEHANNVYLWHRLAQRGVTVRDVPAPLGVLDAAAMIAAIGPRTRLVTLASVSFTPGLRYDVAAIAAAAHRHGALVLVDGVQSCGVLETNVRALGIDALATSASKGLLGIRGSGFLYVAKGCLDRLVPMHVARTSMEVRGHYSAFEGVDVPLRPDARRFEVGSYNYVGIAVVRASMGELLDLGIDRIETRAKSIAASLREGLAAQGHHVVMPRTPAEASHLVTIGRRGNGGADSTGDPKLDALSHALTAANVVHTIRRCQLRFGFHFYNDESDVAAILAVAARHPTQG